MKINWKVRLKNKNFWIAIIPASLLLVQVIAEIFGYSLDLGDIGNKLLALVNTAFAVLSILGIVTDPTTAGVSDSEQALTYDKPKSDVDKALDKMTEAIAEEVTEIFSKKEETETKSENEGDVSIDEGK